MTTTKATQDVLAMTEDDIAALVTNAQTAATAAADEARLAEQVLRGDLPADQAPKSLREVSAAKLAELRQAAEHAGLKVSAAERRATEIREQQIQARQAEIRATIEAEAADDLQGAQQLIDALDVYESALKGLCEAFAGHNARVARWDHLMSQAGISHVHGEHRGPGVLSHTVRGETVSVGQRIFRSMPVGGFIASVLFRILSPYPRDFVRHRGHELTQLGDIADARVHVDIRTGGAITHGNHILHDLHDLIRRNA